MDRWRRRLTNADFKAHREKLGWTQKQTSEALGLTIAQIRAIENNRSSVTKTVALLFGLYQPFDLPGEPSGTRK